MDPTFPPEERPPDPRDDGARDRVISEEAFLAILREAEPQRELFSFYELAPRDPARWKKRHCSALLERSHELETFLDDFHARNNRRFVYFAELTACLRNFAEVAHTLNHLDVRFAAYDVRFGASDEEHRDRMWEFRSELTQAIAFVNEQMVKLLLALRDEALRFGLAAADLKPLGGPVPEDRARPHLPHDVDQEEVGGKGGAIPVILGFFLQIADKVRRLGAHLPRTSGTEELKSFVRQHFDETQARMLKAQVHNLQSSYDTYIKPTRVHEEVKELRRLRGHVSLALHLFEAANHLVHFYERHESEEIKGATKERIAAVVDRKVVLHHVVQFAARHGIAVIARAEPLVQALLPRFVQQQTLELDVPDGGILHARPLSLIVGVVHKHSVPVEMIVDGDTTPANSLMRLILFLGRHPGTRRVTFRGDRAPLEDLGRLFTAGLGERGLDQLPAELAYLRER